MASIFTHTVGIRNLLKPSEITRCYSVFPPHYRKPIYKKDEQQIAQSNEEMRDTLKHAKFIPPRIYDTSSDFHDASVKQFTNYIMRKGQKVLARSLLEKTFEIIKRKQLEQYHIAPLSERDEIILDPTKIFKQAVTNVQPTLELISAKKGGITYKVPAPLTPKRAQFLAMNWLIQTAKEKDRGLHITESLAKELMTAAHNEGRTVQRKVDLHKQCYANRAYAHFRWSK